MFSFSSDQWPNSKNVIVLVEKLGAPSKTNRHLSKKGYLALWMDDIP
jgi:hypothetical protein